MIYVQYTLFVAVINSLLFPGPAHSSLFSNFERFSSPFLYRTWYFSSTDGNKVRVGAPNSFNVHKLLYHMASIFQELCNAASWKEEQKVPQ